MGRIDPITGNSAASDQLVGTITLVVMAAIFIYLAAGHPRNYGKGWRWAFGLIAVVSAVVVCASVVIGVR